MRKRFFAIVLAACAVALLQTGVAGAQIAGTSGGIVQVGPPPSLMQDELASFTEAFAFDELQDVTLSSPVPVDITEPGEYDEIADLTNSGVVPAGAVVDSHLVHADKPGSGGGPVNISGTVTFDTDIVGIQVLGATLNAGDGQLGLPGTWYPAAVQRQVGLAPTGDRLILQLDRRTVFIRFNVNAHVDQVRVITEASKRVPGVTSEVHDSTHSDITGATVSAGTVVHDKAIVTGSGPTPTGTVDFARYTNGDCSGTPVETESGVPLGADGTAESSNFTTVVGSMAYKVTYSGDTIYEGGEGPCEPLHVEDRTPEVRTEVHTKYHHKDITGEAVRPGTWIHDKAIVTGNGPTPTGTVNFVRYGNADCSGYPVAAQNGVALTDGKAESANISVNGDISYKVHYNGDSNYAPADGPCEPLYVEKWGCEGCSSYYWKTHTSKWVNVSPNDSFEAIFGRDVFAGDPTMLEVLSSSGGGVTGLARESAAAYVNARHPSVDYPLTSTELVHSFKVVYDSDRSLVIEIGRAILAALNSKNCPLKWW